MSKNILIKFIILLVASALIYSVFWFFKAGQLNKQVNGFVNQHSNYVSVGEVAISGFPLTQKVTIKDLKFTAPGSLVSKRQTIIKHLEAKAGILSSTFTLALIEPVFVQDNDGNLTLVEFTKNPEISASIASGGIFKFNYKDFGYKISDLEKNIIYAAGSSEINLESFVNKNDAMTTKISASIKDIEGFGISDIYKNLFEKRIIESLKTGEITLGRSENVDQEKAPEDIFTIEESDNNSARNKNDLASKNSSETNAPIENKAAEIKEKAPAIAESVNSENTAKEESSTEENSIAKMTVDPITEVAIDTSLVKSNLIVELEYSLIPNKDDQQLQIPTDPTQIQEIPVQHSKVVKITNLQFFNPLYKIIISGEMSIFADDNMPSGSASIEIEKVGNLINYLNLSLNKNSLEKTSEENSDDVKSSDLDSSNDNMDRASYEYFLKRFSAGLEPVSQELAAKNVTDKTDTVQFNIKREKNLEFLINETSIREILGKF